MPRNAAEGLAAGERSLSRAPCIRKSLVYSPSTLELGCRSAIKGAPAARFDPRLDEQYPLRGRRKHLRRNPQVSFSPPSAGKNVGPVSTRAQFRLTHVSAQLENYFMRPEQSSHEGTVRDAPLQLRVADWCVQSRFGFVLFPGFGTKSRLDSERSP